MVYIFSEGNNIDTLCNALFMRGHMVVIISRSKPEASCNGYIIYRDYDDLEKIVTDSPLQEFSHLFVTTRVDDKILKILLKKSIFVIRFGTWPTDLSLPTIYHSRFEAGSDKYQTHNSCVVSMGVENQNIPSLEDNRTFKVVLKESKTKNITKTISELIKTAFCDKCNIVISPSNNSLKDDALLMKNICCLIDLDGDSIELCLLANGYSIPVICKQASPSSEYIIHSITGYHVITDNELVCALTRIDNVKPKTCQDNARQYSLERYASEIESFVSPVVDAYMSLYSRITFNPTNVSLYEYDGSIGHISSMLIGMDEDLDKYDFILSPFIVTLKGGRISRRLFKPKEDVNLTNIWTKTLLDNTDPKFPLCREGLGIFTQFISLRNCIDLYGIKEINKLTISLHEYQDSSNEVDAFISEVKNVAECVPGIVTFKRSLSHKQFSELKKVGYEISPKHGKNTFSIVKRYRIAVWSDKERALGRMHRNLSDALKDKYHIDIINYNDVTESSTFITNGWKNYYRILGNTSIIWAPCEMNYVKKLDSSYISRCRPVCHIPKFNNERFRESLDESLVNVNIAGISNEVCEMIKTNRHCSVSKVSTFVDCKAFPLVFKPTSVKTLGFIGKPHKSVFGKFVDGKLEPTKRKQYDIVRRPELFMEIARETDCNTKYIFNKTNEITYELYRDVDLMVCTSIWEGGPVSLLEAAACGCGVISTSVGVIREHDVFKTFETVEEAIEIVKHFKENPLDFIEYRKKVTNYVRERFDISNKEVLSSWIKFIESETD